MAYSIAFLVTTYNRERSCTKLIKEISKFGDVYVVIDGSEYQCNWIGDYPIYIFNQKHKGKQKYYETINTLFSLPRKEYDFYFMIPDDFLPVDGFVDKAIRTWNKIRNPKKICLTTYLSKGREGVACWTDFKPIHYKGYWQTQWTDMCFMCKSAFFKAVVKVPPIRHRWSKRPELSSGVGAWISRRLHGIGLCIYQVDKSLFVPQKESYKSQMNPWRKKTDPINIPVL